MILIRTNNGEPNLKVGDWYRDEDDNTRWRFIGYRIEPTQQVYLSALAYRDLILSSDMSSLNQYLVHPEKEVRQLARSVAQEIKCKRPS